MKHKFSLRTYLVLLMLGLLTLGLGVAGAYTSWVSRQVVDAMVEQTIADNTSRVAEQVSNLVSSTEREAKMLALLIEGGDGFSSADFSMVRLRTILPFMDRMLLSNDDIEFLSVTTQEKGELIQVSRGEQGRVLYQINERLGSKILFDKREFYKSQGREVLVSRDVQWKLDSRNRPYYSVAKNARRLAWTDPYEFVRRADEKESTVGVTCCIPLLDQNGTLLGVVTADISLGRLSRFLRSLEVGSSGFGMVYRGDPSRKGSMLAGPELATIRVKALLKSLNVESGNATDISTFTIDSNGEKFVAGWRSTPPEGADWRVYAMAPQRDFTKALDSGGRTVFSFGVWMLLVGAGVALLISARISKSLVEVSDQARAIRELKLEEGATRSSGIREVAELEESVNSLRIGMQSFSRLVPKTYVRRLIRANAEILPGGDRRNITALFADLNGFTALSESEELSRVFDILNEYLSFISELVQAREGTIDKFLGDEVMAFWGAPEVQGDGSLRAIDTALTAKARIGELSTKLNRQVGLRIGIATGSMIVGNIGTRDRLNYTIVGDRANLASRLQNLNRLYGTTILVDDVSYSACSERFNFRPVDLVAVYGKDEAVQIYEPLADDEEALAQATSKAYWAYQDKQFTKAKILYYETLLEYPGDELCQVMMERCKGYEKIPPPTSWGGTHTIRSK